MTSTELLLLTLFLAFETLVWIAGRCALWRDRYRSERWWREHWEREAKRYERQVHRFIGLDR